MIAKAAELARQGQHFIHKRPKINAVATQPIAGHELQHDKLGPATGITLALLMGALCWGIIISAVMHLR